MPKSNSFNKVFLFTLQFPYGKGEAFLESELPFLCKAFEEVVLVPRDKGKQSRDIPENASIDNSFNELIPKGARLGVALLIALIDFRLWKELLLNPVLLKKRKSITALFYYSIVRKAIDKWLGQARPDDQDLIYTYWVDSYTYGLCVNRKLQKHTIVTRAHRFDLYQYIRHVLPHRKQIFNRINKVITIAQDGANYLIDQCKVNSSKVVLARLGVFDTHVETERSQDGVLRIVSCSSFMTQKRVDLIAKSIQKTYEQSGQKIVWTHMGDGEHKKRVEQIVETELSKDIEVNFLGSILNQEVLSFYKENPVDVFINLSSSEGVPVSIMEAQCCAIPVVATDVGGVAEIVNKSNGVLLSSNPTLEEVAHALLQFAPSESNETITNYKRQARKSWQETYDADHNYTAFTYFLQSLA